MLHLYAVTATDTALPAIQGVDGVQVEGVDAGSLRAVASTHDVTPRGDRNAAIAHADVVAAVVAVGAAVPLRFGNRSSQAGQVRTLLDERAATWLAALRDVGDRVEYAVRPRAPVETASRRHAVLDQADSTVDGEHGRSYLEARRAAEHERRHRVQVRNDRLREVTDELSALARTTCWVQGPVGAERCFLVGRDEAAGFERHVSGILGRAPEFVLTGPWPPYTFASSLTEAPHEHG